MFKANFGAIEAAAADIQTGAGGIETRLSEMDSALQPLRADWTGAAAESYQQAKAQWSSAITDMKLLLSDIGRAVSQGNADYQNAEQRNAQRFGG
ncbi:WXG100 family type VII secretion target [Pseudactinotalea sp. HY158]|uniref:WXG100 family type VII secretion target n=1 Tax=Pseudactinotalea sp. HY158 TaxID=2654547 RepID=UPI00129C14C9|nr:WXG100 family type VII secretion target [Pseudactinotalea sp. HY158]QGH70460.1 WXG100 family type VII secretion target [Pseudactinotalea sp. HY158]QGH70561.1 WXG100 family type VII secretion target [Pseudactinotalea sp. HY158]